MANCKVVYLWFIEKYPDTGMTVDLFHSPLKPPPWKGAATGLKNAEEELAHCSVVHSGREFGLMGVVKA